MVKESLQFYNMCSLNLSQILGFLIFFFFLNDFKLHIFLVIKMYKIFINFSLLFMYYICVYSNIYFVWIYMIPTYLVCLYQKNDVTHQIIVGLVVKFGGGHIGVRSYSSFFSICNSVPLFLFIKERKERSDRLKYHLIFFYKN